MVISATARSVSMKSVVTGGAGFIGSHLVDVLAGLEHEVVVVDNFCTGRTENLEKTIDQVEVIEADIGKIGDWCEVFKGADWVFHVAALADIVPSIRDPQAYFLTNVNGTFNVLQASARGEVERFVYLASSSCYGIPEVFPTPEDARIQPQYPYAMTKRLGEELVLHWAQVYKLPAVSLRLFNVYGPRSRTSGTYGAVFGVFLAQKLAREPFTVVGDGTQTRDFTYVSDVVDVLIEAAKKDISGEIFNVGSGETVSINRIVDLLDGSKVYVPKRPGEPDCTFADIRKICRQLSWEPKVPIEEGVEKLLSTIDGWRGAPVWTPEDIEEATRDWFRYLGPATVE